MTIEGLGSLKKGYHSLQKALYHFSGSQCGYCSPGMIMNMYGLAQRKNGKVTMKEVENSFGGNICRCTGYRPILDAFKSFATDSCASDIEDLTADVYKMSSIDGKSCSSAGQCCQQSCKKSNALEFTNDDDKKNRTLEFTDDDDRTWIKAFSLDDLLKIIETKTKNFPYMLVAGDTATGVYRRPRNIKVFIDINSVPQLHAITLDDKSFIVGANTTLAEFMRVLKTASTKYDYYEYCARLVKHIDLVANVAVRYVCYLSTFINFIVKKY